MLGGRPPPFSLLAILALLTPLIAQAQTYYFTGNNPAIPGETTVAVTCDGDAIGAIRYNTGTAAFEGCNGVAWADIRNGAIATAVGSQGDVQFNSGGILGASANFFWDNTNGRLGIGTTSPQAALDVNGYMRLAKNSAQPVACSSANDGAVAVTHVYTLCLCNGGSSIWVQSKDGSTACSW